MIQVWKEERKERKKIAWCMVPVDVMVVLGGVWISVFSVLGRGSALCGYSTEYRGAFESSIHSTKTPSLDHNYYHNITCIAPYFFESSWFWVTFFYVEQVDYIQ